MDKIFLESASFKELIKSKALYVDKTFFVKHFLEAEGTAIQVSRPAKWGKTLNLDMLAEYLDVKKDSGDLFDGLAISQWPGFEKHLNKYPVVRLDLKNLKIDDYKIAIRNMLCECIEKYIPEEKMTPKVKSFYFRPAGTDCSNLQSLAKNLHEIYEVKPFVLIDEYDRLFWDTDTTRKYSTAKDYLSCLFDAAFADISKALLIGTTRCYLNREHYDAFRPGPFEEDFGLTNKEALRLLPEEKMDDLLEWYGGYWIGKTQMRCICSCLKFLESGELELYWSDNDLAIKLVKLLSPQLAVKVTQLFRTSMDEPKAVINNDAMIEPLHSLADVNLFFSLAYEIGLAVTFDELSRERLGDQLALQVPNREISLFLKNKMISHFLGDEKEFAKIFAMLTGGNLAEFDILLSNFITNRLPLLGKKSAQNKAFMLLFTGLKLGLGQDCGHDSFYKCIHYMLSGSKRGVIILLNSAESKRGVSYAASRALRTEFGYLASFMKDNTSSFYTIGIGLFKNCASVITELHET
ncbi:MAG: AAA family ATPase [Clostridiales bacterium]|jgi:hypothetical protein|nr:AAA family ATPase [Clostridiales bacterium]